MTKKRTTKKPAKRSAPRDNTKAIIRECVAYSQNIAAFHASFEAAPNTSDLSETLSDKFGKRACCSLERLSEMFATSELAIEAKARIVRMILDDNGDSMEPREQAFFRTFGSEVHKYFRGLNEHLWREKKKLQEKQEGGAS